MINVYTVFVKSEVYTKEWVYKLNQAIKKNSTVDFNFHCLTNESLPGINVIPIHNVNGWWSKMELCRPDIEGIIHYFDLDTIITGNIDFLLNEKRNCLYEDWLYPSQKESALFILNDEKRKKIWDFWIKDPEAHMFNFFGDGRIYNFCIGKETDAIQQIHPNKIFTYKKTNRQSLPVGCKILCFSGTPKQSDFPNEHWIKKYYW